MNGVRTCGWCGVDINDMNPRAQYCGRQHKKNAASKRHRERNPGYFKRYHGSPARVAWLEENKELVRSYAREYARQYRTGHPDAARAWWTANKDKHRLYQANRRAAKSAHTYIVTERDVTRLIARYDGCCAYCGQQSNSLHLDHVIPLARGGRHSIGNLVPACRTCNTSKGAGIAYRFNVRRLLTQEAERLALRG